MRSIPISLHLLIIILVYRTTCTQNESKTKCGLPENITQLPEFAQEEIKAVWRNYVPGDDCKQELVITDDILAVLDMLDKDLERQGTRKEDKPLLNAHLTTTSHPISHETLLTTKEIDSTMNSTLPYLQLSTTTILSPPEFTTSVTATQPIDPPDEYADYSDFTTRAAPSVEPSMYTVSQKVSHKSIESSEQPFSFTGSPSGTFTSEFTSATPLAYDYAEPGDQDTSTNRAVRVMKVKIPTDYEEFEKQKHTNGFVERRRSFRVEKTDKAPEDTKFYESFEPPMPFLKDASPQLVRLFKEVMNDPDVVSEQRRQEEIHLLAVSYLNAKQLSAFNNWSSQRRKRIRAREQILYPLSFKAREALKHLALTPSQREQESTALRLPGELRDELKAFAIRLREQHQSEQDGLGDEYRHRSA